jgi:hypothetical protein
VICIATMAAAMMAIASPMPYPRADQFSISCSRDMPMAGDNAVNHRNAPKPMATVVKSIHARTVRTRPPRSRYSSTNAQAASG